MTAFFPCRLYRLVRMVFGFMLFIFNPEVVFSQMYKF